MPRVLTYCLRLAISYLNTLLFGLGIGLSIGYAVMSHQTSLLTWENMHLLDKTDTLQLQTKDCLLNSGTVLKKKQEELVQLERIKQGLALDIDIMNQLKVNLQAKVSGKVRRLRVKSVWK